MLNHKILKNSIALSVSIFLLFSSVASALYAVAIDIEFEGGSRLSVKTRKDCFSSIQLTTNHWRIYSNDPGLGRFCFPRLVNFEDRAESGYNEENDRLITGSEIRFPMLLENGNGLEEAGVYIIKTNIVHSDKNAICTATLAREFSDEKLSGNDPEGDEILLKCTAR